MIRTLAPLGALLMLSLPAQAQFIRTGRPAPRPAGVIAPPQLPVANPASARPAPAMRPFRTFGYPNYGLYGFGGVVYPYLPYDYDYDRPNTVVNNYVTVAPPSASVPPAPPPELRARLTLDIPTNAKVWLAGTPVDTAALPVILESPILQRGQTYTFDVKIAWREGDKTEERSRSVTVEAGSGSQVTYFGGK
ncbi:MAG TPA: hypothetical protein VM597_13690 [Gemmataceae bacterium]|nr:hypothetical protein [Gemmataceae bacterium]